MTHKWLKQHDSYTTDDKNNMMRDLNIGVVYLSWLMPQTTWCSTQPAWLIHDSWIKHHHTWLKHTCDLPFMTDDSNNMKQDSDNMMHDSNIRVCHDVQVWSASSTGGADSAFCKCTVQSFDKRYCGRVNVCDMIFGVYTHQHMSKETCVYRCIVLFLHMQIFRRYCGRVHICDMIHCAYTHQ